MRITFVLDTFGGGGKERRCLQLIQGLNQKGVNDIQVILIHGQVDYPELYQTSADVQVIYKDGKRLSAYATYAAIKKRITTFCPDIVQVWGLMSAFFVNFIRLTNRFKYYGAYVANCNKPQGISFIANRFCCLLSDGIIGNSYAGLNSYEIPKNKQVCIYNGYNKSRLNIMSEEDKTNKRNELGIHAPYVVSMIARVDRNKDFSTFIKVAHNICKKRDDVQFLALGTGEYLKKYRNLVADEYDDCVHFLGFRNDVDEILEITTVSCLFTNSKFHAEGVSNSILESMAHGVPVIATNAGGNPEIVSDGINGFLINENDVNNASDKICMLLGNTDYHAKLSNAAIKTVDIKFNLEDKANEYLELYNMD